VRWPAVLLAVVAAATPLAATASPTPDKPTTPVIADGAALEAYWKGPGTTVVHFWASWCGTCKAELPRLTRALETAQERGARILLVSLDDAPHADAALTLLRHHRVPGTRLRLDTPDSADVTRRVDPGWDAGLPATFVFRDGRRTASLVGALPSPAVLVDALER
jgi:thiol-disulfide isomerase/thioredoxin